MVQLFTTLFKSVKKPLRRYLRSKFIDRLRITVKGGHGGNGMPKYGGIGGQGGCVYFVAKKDITLKDVWNKYEGKRISASSGEDSSKVRLVGQRGLDVRVEVPVGVQVIDENGKVIADLNDVDAKCISAGGGMGGCTGTNFLGKPGDKQTIFLDLKLIADVGLVGFPNAGKSTLLKAISKANPKIASYPFTTIRPQIGSVFYQDMRSITIADLPGLIEGAHANLGLGHTFLKHIERTRLLLLLVDIAGFQLSVKHKPRTCLENIYALNRELELYNSAFLDKPCILLLNKIDTLKSKDLLEELLTKMKDLTLSINECPEELRPTRLLNFERIIPISARKRDGIKETREGLREVLDEFAEKTTVNDPERVKEILEKKLYERGPRLI